MTEETPEQAAESKYGLSDSYSKNRIGFIEGAKWMQERMYSEEEVLHLLNKREDYLGTQPSVFDYLTNEEWFEQYYQETYGGNNE